MILERKNKNSEQRATNKQALLTQQQTNELCVCGAAAAAASVYIVLLCAYYLHYKHKSFFHLKFKWDLVYTAYSFVL
jgi:hypothetical protein